MHAFYGLFPSIMRPRITKTPIYRPVLKSGSLHPAVARTLISEPHVSAISINPARCYSKLIYLKEWKISHGLDQDTWNRIKAHTWPLAPNIQDVHDETRQWRAEKAQEDQEHVVRHLDQAMFTLLNLWQSQATDKESTSDARSTII